MPVLRSPSMLFAFVLFASLTATVLLSVVVMNLDVSNIQQLVLTMSGSGIATTFIAYALYRTGILVQLSSIFWALGLTIVFTVGLILVNVWVLTQMMFISSAYLSIMSSVLIFAGLGAISFGYFIAKAMTDRLQHLSDGAEKLSKGDLTTRLAVNGNDEIAQLTHSFNTMAQELQSVDAQKQQLEQTRRNLVAWVSHDLRTPLASMRVMMEALNDGVVTDEETVFRYMQNTVTEIDNLDHLIDDLFELAQLDVKDIKLNYRATNLLDLVEDTLSLLMPKAKRKHITLNSTVHPDVAVVTIAPDKIQRVLNNLIDNAIKYTPENQRISLNAYPTLEGMQVDISNTGVTIAPEQLPKLFESFYRGESSRVQQDGERGAGLGLAIARGFIEVHGGKIWATSVDDVTTFSFTLPQKSTKLNMSRIAIHKK
jgi:signal transduction histidine kinase